MVALAGLIALGLTATDIEQVKLNMWCAIAFLAHDLSCRIDK